MAKCTIGDLVAPKENDLERDWQIGVVIGLSNLADKQNMEHIGPILIIQDVETKKQYRALNCGIDKLVRAN
jgi:hypothetical protein